SISLADAGLNAEDAEERGGSMALQYYDYASQATPALRLARARLHLSEIEQMLGAPDVSADGKSIDRNALEQKARRLSLEIIPMYEAAAGDVGAPVIVSTVLRELGC